MSSAPNELKNSPGCSPMARGEPPRCVHRNCCTSRVGLLSLDDVLMLLAEELKVVGDLLEKETPSGAI